MNSEFIIMVRKLSRNLPFITENDVKKLETLRFNLAKEIERTIINHPEIGKRHLSANLTELTKDFKLIELRIKGFLENLEADGKDEYDNHFSNVKNIGETYWDAINELLQILLDYFPEGAIKNKKIYEKFGTPDQIKKISFPLIKNNHLGLKHSQTATSKVKLKLGFIEDEYRNGKQYNDIFKELEKELGIPWETIKALRNRLIKDR